MVSGERWWGHGSPGKTTGEPAFSDNWPGTVAELRGIDQELELRAFAEQNWMQRSSDVLTNRLLCGCG